MALVSFFFFMIYQNISNEVYAKELKKLLTSDSYRFHLKVLLINDIGFYTGPFVFEQKIVEKILLKKIIYFQLFLESINSLEWFEFICKKEEFQKLIPSNDNEIQNTLTKLCVRLITQYPQQIINFLESNTISSKIIENTLFYIQDKDVHLSHNLYKKIAKKTNFNLRDDFHSLEKSVKNYMVLLLIKRCILMTGEILLENSILKKGLSKIGINQLLMVIRSSSKMLLKNDLHIFYHLYMR